MTKKKLAKKDRRKVTEPFLTTVARRIGSAAGSLAKATHAFTTNEASPQAASSFSHASGTKQNRPQSRAGKDTSASPRTRGTPRRGKKAAAPSKKGSAAKPTGRIKSFTRKK
jgi:hypothetical protein